jgi:membrane protease YdiL (CAAX protease family)
MMDCNQAPNASNKTWRDWFFEPIEQANSLQRADDVSKNLKAWCGLIGSVGCLLILRFFFLQNEQYRLVKLLEFLHLREFADQLEYGISDPLGRLTVWAFGCLLCYFIIPALMVRLLLREKLSDYGFRFASFRDAMTFILPGFIGMAPPIYFASTQIHFLHVYPFYEPNLSVGIGAGFILWELMYAMQFIALEFFFRGFMVHCLMGVMGAWAIPVMVIPYCMIHFQKPFPEATASIIAGLALGWIGIKTKSILPGAILHIAVAWSMDGISLIRKGYFN